MPAPTSFRAVLDLAARHLGGREVRLYPVTAAEDARCVVDGDRVHIAAPLPSAVGEPLAWACLAHELAHAVLWAGDPARYSDAAPDRLAVERAAWRLVARWAARTGRHNWPRHWAAGAMRSYKESVRWRQT